MKNEIKLPLVSICCTAYNLEKYIGQAIESFLYQKTSFPYEIIIGEDGSTDSTSPIIEHYRSLHPDKISIISSGQNVGMIENWKRILAKAKGKYIAICDGDDFWTSPNKLQKQIEFLESQENYAMCCHYSEVIDTSGKTIYVDENPVPLEYNYEDILLGRKKETRTSSIVLLNSSEFQEYIKRPWFRHCYNNDTFFKLFATASGKKVYVIPEVMSCYRIHGAGIWSLIDPKTKALKSLSDFNTILKHLNFSKKVKRELLRIYFKKFFFFEMKQLRIRSSLKTLSSMF